LVIAFLRALFLHWLAHKLMVSQQFVSMVAAIMCTLSNVFLFQANQMFQAIAMKIVGQSTLRAGCTYLGLVTVPYRSYPLQVLDVEIPPEEGDMRTEKKHMG
jgi:hypothetical protein